MMITISNWMTILKIITDTIPRFAEPRINSSKVVDGDVSEMLRNRRALLAAVAAAAVTIRRVLGEGSKSSVFAFGVWHWLGRFG